jgi:hypothetical protein
VAFLLPVGWVAVLAEDALYQDAELGADVLPQGPVDRHVVPHRLHQLARDRAEGSSPRTFTALSFVSSAS